MVERITDFLLKFDKQQHQKHLFIWKSSNLPVRFQ